MKIFNGEKHTIKILWEQKRPKQFSIKVYSNVIKIWILPQLINILSLPISLPQN